MKNKSQEREEQRELSYENTLEDLADSLGYVTTLEDLLLRYTTELIKLKGTKQEERKDS